MERRRSITLLNSILLSNQHRPIPRPDEPMAVVDDMASSGLAEILNALESGTTVEVSLTRVDEEHLRILAPSLVDCSCWRKLSLSNGRLNKSHVDEIARIIMSTRARVKLLECVPISLWRASSHAPYLGSLSWNRIDCDGAVRLVSNIRQHTTLMRLR